MHSNEFDSIDTVHFIPLLREKIQKLILLNSTLQKRVNQLEVSLKESEKKVAGLRAQNTLANSNKNNAGFSSPLGNSLGDEQTTKMKLHQMVLEVEKCIEILEFRGDK